MLAAHPGGSQGRPGTTSGSQPISQYGLPYLLLPEAPKPGRRAYAGPRCFRGEVSCPDNGPGYVSHLHARACRALGVRHLRTRPYRPQTNGKGERFIQTLTRGWAYGQIYRTSAERTLALGRWLDWYNQERPHGSLNRQTPAGRLQQLQLTNAARNHI